MIINPLSSGSNLDFNQSNNSSSSSNEFLNILNQTIEPSISSASINQQTLTTFLTQMIQEVNMFEKSLYSLLNQIMQSSPAQMSSNMLSSSSNGITGVNSLSLTSNTNLQTQSSLSALSSISQDCINWADSSYNMSLPPDLPSFVQMGTSTTNSNPPIGVFYWADGFSHAISLNDGNDTAILRFDNSNPNLVTLLVASDKSVAQNQSSFGSNAYQVYTITQDRAKQIVSSFEQGTPLLSLITSAVNQGLSALA